MKVGFEVLTAVSMKMAVFWVVAPCSLVNFIALMMEAARTCETMVNFYQTTRRYDPEDSHLHLISSSVVSPNFSGIPSGGICGFYVFISVEISALIPLSECIRL
jgi:hypothetical protein